MKKVLLSLAVIAAAMVTANAQSVGVGMYDDFATVGNSTDNPTGEYSKQFTVGANTYTGGLFWYTDANYTSTYTKTRANGVMTIAVNKGTEYSVVGAGFGDTNGDGTGTSFTLDISGNKTFSINLQATVAVAVDVQIQDINGTKIEISGQNDASGVKEKYEAAVTTTAKTFTFNFGDARLIDYTAANGGYPCANYPTDCPVTLSTNNFDYTQVAKINFLISGGTAYTGTVTFDEFKLGTVRYVGLGTTAAAANIASTKVFPNPATDQFTAEVITKNGASSSIIITDMMGKQIATKATDANGQATFPTSSLAKGMYTVTYVLDGTPAKTELVVVK